MIRNLCRKYSSNPIAQFNIFQPSLSQKLIKQVGNFGVTVNNTIYRGPIAIIDNHVFLSNVKQFGLPQTTENPEKTQLIDDPNSIFHQWNTEPLKAFTVADPKPDILVIGTGSKLFQLPKMLKDYLLSHDIQVEVQKTRSAAATFNVLAQEGRRSALLLLPEVPTSSVTGEVLVDLKKNI